MAEPDPLARAFARLRIHPVPGIAPPGVEAARRTVRRRRVVRASIVAVLAIVGLSLTPLLLSDRPGSLPADGSSGPSRTVTASHSANPGTFGSSPAGSNAGGPGAGQNRSCASDGIGQLISRDGKTLMIGLAPVPMAAPSASPSASASASASPSSADLRPCASLRVVIYWAAYQPNQVGDLIRYDYGHSTIRQGAPTVPIYLRLPPCDAVWYVWQGAEPPETIATGAPKPTWDDRHDRDGLIATDTTGPCQSPTVTPTPTP